MDGIEFDITGVDEVVDMLDRADRIVSTTGLTLGLNRAGNVIADAVELATPVREENPEGGNSLDKGVLRENVTLDVTIDSRSRGGSARIHHGKYSYVANFLEMGHRLLSHGAKSIRRVIGNVRPFPFLRPTASKIEMKAHEAFEEGMRSVLDVEGITIGETEEVA